jgi:formate hydrogenlyase subunit 6/NADH:ubiquinone oxidoreductase subunit I
LALRRGLSTIEWPAQAMASEGPERGVPVFDPSSCTACGDCVGTCPAECIALEDGWPVPVVDAGTCTRCGLCIAACEERALTLAGPPHLAAYSREDLVMDGNPAKEVDVGPAPSRLYRASVRGVGRSWVEPSRLLEERSEALLRRGRRKEG